MAPIFVIPGSGCSHIFSQNSAPKWISIVALAPSAVNASSAVENTTMPSPRATLTTAWSEERTVTLPSTTKSTDTAPPPWEGANETRCIMPNAGERKFRAAQRISCCVQTLGVRPKTEMREPLRSRAPRQMNPTVIHIQ